MAIEADPGECGSSCECRSNSVPRREFLQLVGLGAAAAFTASDTVMAGPFERADFDKLVPADKKLSPEWIKSLFARGEPTVYRGEELKYIGMPIGGIGAGYLYLGGDGKLWHWDIFNKTGGTGADHYANPMKPESPLEQGFAIRVSSGGRTETRTLDRTGFPGVSFRGQYPIGTVEYVDAAFPLKIILEAFSPFIPLATDDSSLPATILRFTVTNTSVSDVKGTLAGWLQNAVLRGSPGRQATRHNRIDLNDQLSVLNCTVEALAPTSQPFRPDVIFEDWNKDNYEGWTVEGTAFGTQPAHRVQAYGYMGDLGGEGDRMAHSHVTAPGADVNARDAQVGKLTSKPFAIDRRFIQFWIDGGNHSGKTCINLLVGGKVVLTATGANQNRMALRMFDVAALAGQSATIEIVDAEKGPWGNIGIGKITFSDRPAVSDNMESQPDFGSMALALIGAPAEHAMASGGKGGFDGKTGNDAKSDLQETLIGAIGRNFKVAPGQSANIDFVITWHFPNLRLEGLPSKGRHYGVKFSSAFDVAHYIMGDFDRLAGNTRLWRDTWYDSTLPYWFLDRTFLNACILATSTSFRFADGRFYSWEGVGCCAGTCAHVWHYAHTMSRLFPDLERDTRQRVDLGVGFDPSSGIMGFRAEFDRGLAVDGQSGTLLRMYREHQMSADDAFLRRNWPKIKKAYEPLLKLDANEDGILEGPQMNTLDMAWFGKVAWLSSLYLAAVRAGEAMAREMGDAKFADRCKIIAERGAKNVVDQLFDGEYFYNRVDQNKLDAINSGTGCEIDQVFGQSWAFQVHLGRVLPPEQTRAALQSLWKYNFTPDVGPYRKTYKPGRWYAMTGEAGLLMCTFPRADWDYNNAHGAGGAEWAAGYFNECMNGFEHQVAGHMIWEGMVQEGLAVERAIHDRYSASRRNPWNEIECGDHYSRSMASFGVFIAACGYEYHGPAGYLAFAPRLSPENFKAAFTAAEGWGTYEQQSTGEGLKAAISLKYGRLRLRTLALGLPEKSSAKAVAVRVNGKAVDATLDREEPSRPVRIALAADAVIGAGQTIEIAVT